MVAQSIPVLVKRQQKQNGKNNIGCTRRLYKINVQRNRNVKQKLQFIRLTWKVHYRNPITRTTQVYENIYQGRCSN